MENREGMYMRVVFTTNPAGDFTQSKTFKTEQEFQSWFTEIRKEKKHFRLHLKDWFPENPWRELWKNRQVGLRTTSRRCDGSTDACIVGKDY